MKVLVCLILLMIILGCHLSRFNYKNNFILEKRLEVVYHGATDMGNAPSSIWGINLSGGRGPNADSVVAYLNDEAYYGPATMMYRDFPYQYNYWDRIDRVYRVDSYYITDYVRGREVGYRYVDYAEFGVIEFGYIYPSSHFKIQCDSIGQIISIDYKNLDTSYFTDAVVSCEINGDSLLNELLKPDWFEKNYTMNYVDSVNSRSQLIESDPYY